MRSLIIAAPLLVSFTVHAQTSNDVHAIAKGFNKNLSGVTLCDPKGSVLAEVDDGQGGKKLVRTAQNTWSDFKPDGNGYASYFTAFHRNSKTGEVRPSKMMLRLVPEGSENIDPVSGKKKVQLQLSYEGASDIAAKYDASIDDQGGLDIFETSSKINQFKRGKEHVDKGAMSYATNIKVSQANGKTNYVIDEVLYHFNTEQVTKVEKELGKKLFTDVYNEKKEEFEGLSFTSDEMKKLAETAGIKPDIKTGVNWSNCPAVTEAEALNFAKNTVEKHNKSLKSKKANNFKSSGRKSVKGEKMDLKSIEKKVDSQKATIQ